VVAPAGERGNSKPAVHIPIQPNACHAATPIDEPSAPPMK
jgi:hypothetical protein